MKEKHKLLHMPLRKRIRKLLRISNTASILGVMAIILVITTILLGVFGYMYTTNQAYQTSIIVSDQWDKNPEGFSNEEYISYILDSFQIGSFNFENKSLDVNTKKVDIYLDQDEDILELFATLGSFIEYKVVMFNDTNDSDLVYSNYDDGDMFDQHKSLADTITSIFGTTSESYIYHDQTSEYMDMEGIEDSMISDGPSPNAPMDQADMIDALMKENHEIKPIGKVTVRVNPRYILFVLSLVLFSSLGLIFIFSLIGRIFSSIMAKIIASPITDISNKIETLAQGDIESSMNNNIVIDRPVYEVKKLMDSTNLIMAKMTEFTHTLEQQNSELEAQTEELQAQRDELEAQNTTLNERGKSLSALNNAYLSRTLKLQNLLDNVDQGFLTFEKDLLVNPEYSLQCESMISSDNVVANKHIVPMLFINEKEDQPFIEDLLNKIFNCEADQQNLYLSLLPEEITINGYILNLNFKMVHNEVEEKQMLLIITNITEQRAMEQQIEKERNVLQMIVKVLQNRTEFLDIIKDFRLFASSDFGQLSKLKFDDTLREIHTNKGVFAQYYMTHITDYLNDLEDVLHKEKDPAMMASISYEQLIQALEADLSVIESYVGHDFLYDETIYTIKEEGLSNIENRIKELLPSTEYMKVLPLIKSIRHKSLKQQLSTYADYTVKLGERLDKSVAPFTVEGDDVLIDPMIYGKLTKSLIHVFRNAVDHGIEDTDLRIEQGKHQTSHISCKTIQFMDHFEIIISDDGSGIDLSILKEKAINSGIIAEDENISDTDLIQLIFADGISTKDNVSALSGRGVGLAAVRNAVEELGGHIKVESIANKGTTFTFSLPYITDTAITAFTPEKLLKQISRVSEGYMNKLNIPLHNFKLETRQQITLHRISALINVKGSMEAILIISVNESMAEKMVNTFMVDDALEEPMIQYMEDVLGEVTNTIMGNVLGLLEEDEVYLSLGIPALITNKDAYIKYTQSEIVSATYNNDSDILTINLLMIDNGDGNTLYQI